MTPRSSSTRTRGTERARLCIKPGATESSNYSVLVTRGREVYDLCENTNCTEGNTVARSGK